MRKREEARKNARNKGNATLRALAICGIAALVLVAVAFVPTPGNGKKSGIALYGDDPEAVLYGPVLPQTMPEIMPGPVPDEVLLPDLEDEEDVLYVYASDDQECYHLGTCKFAYASGHRFTVAEARLLGYKPCGRCNPPAQ